MKLTSNKPWTVLFGGNGENLTKHLLSVQQTLKSNKLGYFLSEDAKRYEPVEPSAAFLRREMEAEPEAGDDKAIRDWMTSSRSYTPELQKAQHFFIHTLSEEIQAEIKIEFPLLENENSLKSFLDIIRWLKKNHGSWTVDAENMRSALFRQLEPWKTVAEAVKGITTVQELRDQGHDWSKKKCAGIDHNRP